MSQSHKKAEAVTVTSSDVLDDAKALGAKITALVGPAPALTKADVQRSVKLRKGGEEVVKTIASLSDKFGLVVPSQPTSTMVAKIDQAQSLVALHQELVAATKHVADTIFQAQSQSWAGATAHYSMLRRLGKMDGSVNTALAPVTQFFAARSTAATEEAKASRGGARKGTEAAKANRAAKRAKEATILATAQNQAPAAGSAPTVATLAPTGPSPAPQAAPATPSNATSAH